MKLTNDKLRFDNWSDWASVSTGDILAGFPDGPRVVVSKNQSELSVSFAPASYWRCAWFRVLHYVLHFRWRAVCAWYDARAWLASKIYPGS
jgi:uncharacterized protein YodC (DUF2158 family)